MSNKILNDVVHSDIYNPGGINSIYLLEMKGFQHYKFIEDKCFDIGLVDKIERASNYEFIHLGAEQETSFTESFSNGIYQQSLTSFVRTLKGEKLSRLLKLSNKKFVVVFQTNQDKGYTFGSDGGVSLKFNQQTGKLGETAGYSITMEKRSIYPLFEMDLAGLNMINIIANESGIGYKTSKGQYILV